MKKIFYTILACSAITASCSGFLDKTPTDKLSSDLVYTNQTLAENAVRGVYNNLIWDFNSTDNVKYNWDAYAGVLDPVDYFRGSIAFLSGNVLSTNGVFSTFWKQYYETISFIYRTNVVRRKIYRRMHSEHYKSNYNRL